MIIGLYSEDPGHGKTELALRLAGSCPGVRRISIADPIKKALGTLLELVGYTEDQRTRLLYGSSEDRETTVPELGGRTVRYLLRTLGTEWGRDLITPTVWSDITEKRAAVLMEQGWSLVVDDVRMPEELAALYRLGGTCYELHWPQVVSTGQQHASDGALTYVDLPRLINDGHPATLQRFVEELCHRHSVS